MYTYKLEGINFNFELTHDFEKGDLTETGGADYICSKNKIIFEVKKTLSNIDYKKISLQFLSSLSRYLKYKLHLGYKKLTSKNSIAYAYYLQNMKLGYRTMDDSGMNLEEKLIFQKTKLIVKIWNTNSLIKYSNIH